MFTIKKEVKDLNRFRQIITILIEEGFGYLLYELKIKHPKLFFKKFKKDSLNNPQRFVKTLERLGPTFIKFGQLLSVRPDLVPKEYIKELEKLQDKVPPAKFESVKKVIEHEYKKDIKDVFSSFNEKPIASASISQVYEAKLKTGEKVAVKVLRPRVKEIMDADIDIMYYLAHLMEHYLDHRWKVKPVEIVDEFAKWTERELDLRLEARNAKRFRRNFENSKIVYIPKIYDPFTTEHILVEEFIEGIEMHNYFLKKRSMAQIEKITNRGLDAILTQVFVHGFFHADPHPGNIFIMNNDVMAFVDFGIVGYFDEHLKQLTLTFLYGVVNQDYDKVIDVLVELGKIKKEDINTDALKNDIMDVLEPLQSSSLENVKISTTLENLFDIALNYNIKPDHAFVIFGKALMELEGLGLKYNPKIKLVAHIKPFLEHLIAQRLNPKSFFSTLAFDVRNFGSFLRKLPSETEKALQRIQSGTFKVDIDKTELYQLALEIDKSSNRVTYGILIASLLVTGALLVNIGTPIYFNMPLFSLVLFIIAGLFFLVLVASIFNEKKLKKNIGGGS